MGVALLSHGVRGAGLPAWGTSRSAASGLPRWSLSMPESSSTRHRSSMAAAWATWLMCTCKSCCCWMPGSTASNFARPSRTLLSSLSVRPRSSRTTLRTTLSISVFRSSRTTLRTTLSISVFRSSCRCPAERTALSIRRCKSCCCLSPSSIASSRGACAADSHPSAAAPPMAEPVPASTCASAWCRGGAHGLSAPSPGRGPAPCTSQDTSSTREARPSTRAVSSSRPAARASTALLQSCGDASVRESASMA
mmetsp:Transcript_119958/g.373600  ORF Transcript_119958/g.373600 Transcript_119958/m.373600 type:complete len:251 (+) Transcript_119958:628-1380(+)